MQIKVKLTIPEDEKHKSPKYDGEHYSYDGQIGTVLCGASKDAVYVQFGNDISKYVGCPIAWLTEVQ